MAVHAHDAPASLVDSLRRTSFGVLRDTGWPAGWLARIEAEWLAFFRSDAPSRSLSDSARHGGFFPDAVSERAVGAQARELKEFFHLVPGGRFPGEVSDAALRYRALAVALGTMLLRWIGDHTPADILARFSQPPPGMIADSPLTLLRILHDPPRTGDEDADAVRAAAHQDIDLLPILPASAGRDLDVQRHDGAWLAVPAAPARIVVNVGDVLRLAAGGLDRSTTHRVVHPAAGRRGTARISMPMFLQPRADIVLSGGNIAGAFLAERLAAIDGRA